MKVKPPKAWESLPPAQKRAIEEYALSIARKQNEKDGRIMLDLYIKMVCVTLHDFFGYGEKRLTLFLGNHRALFFDQRRMVAENTQIEYLNERMAQIFKKNGFPQMFFDKMLGEVETPTENKTEEDKT